jgi:predicted peroxiredoxin
MTEVSKKLVVLATCGLHDERTTVAWTVANGGMTSGLSVSMFLASSGVDCVRKGAGDSIQMNPEDPPLKTLIQDFMDRGGTVWACAPCVKIRGYTQEDLIEGVIITGSGPMHATLKEGASSLSF